MKTLLKYADLSDENRWLAKGYNFDFKITDNDKEVLSKLRVIGEGEYTGIVSGLLLPKMIMEQVPREFISDWSQIIVYMNIIVYEEFRHGLTISKLSGGETDVAKADIFNLEGKDYWDAYGLLVSHCLSEMSNILLYKGVIKELETPELIDIFNNIKRDEIRHMMAWKDLIKDLIDSNEYHKGRCKDSLKDGITIHNAFLGPNFDKGVEDTICFFDSGAVISLMKSKRKIINEWFN